jgi:hypothetical protein
LLIIDVSIAKKEKKGCLTKARRHKRVKSFNLYEYRLVEIEESFFCVANTVKFISVQNHSTKWTSGKVQEGWTCVN